MANGFWSVLKNAGLKVGLVEEVPDEVAPVVTPVTSGSFPAPTNGQSVQAQTAVAPNPEMQARMAQVDQHVREELSAAMESSGAALVEELGDLLETLRESIPDERVRYTTAIKIIVKKGGSVAAICTDIDKCIGVLEAKDREFNATLKSQFDKRVGGKSELVASCEEQMATKQSQIAALNSEISELASKLQEAQSGIVVEKDKLLQVQTRFGYAYNAIKTEIELQRSKVTQYGGQA